jgi:hypothetical protein
VQVGLHSVNAQACHSAWQFRGYAIVGLHTTACMDDALFE